MPEQEQPIPNTSPPPKSITLTISDQSTMAKVVDLIVRKKPVGWSRRSYASYYKESYAKWLQKDIDEMMVDRQPRIYRYDMWPSVSKNSLYLRVNQATAYLLDNLDPEQKYKKFFSELKCKKEPDGIALRLDIVIEGKTSPQAEKFIGASDKPAWKIKMDDWIEDSTREEPFFKGGLLLSPEEIKQLELELDGSGILYSITSREIKLIKQ